jgi:predicted methyltransferase
MVSMSARAAPNTELCTRCARMCTHIQSRAMDPLLTLKVVELMRGALRTGMGTLMCSLDLERSTTLVAVDESGWTWGERRFPYPEECNGRTIYHWFGALWMPAARYTTSLIKLVPTEWGPPTFEIDGIKMLPTARISPYADAQRKVGLIEPRGKVILDTCGGLGYFAAWCIQGRAAQVLSYEKSPDVLWLRSLNPWSPATGGALTLIQADITEQIQALPARSVDAVLHDPPRFGIAGELYSQVFYDQLARVLRRRGRLFHYVGAPNRLTSQRNVPGEVTTRLRRAGFATQLERDGVLAVRN